MKYIDEFRDRKLIERLSHRIFETAPGAKISIMEVCGTHTQSFRRFGLSNFIPPNFRLIAGPGCPVCVSDQGYIDKAIQLSRKDDAIIVSFGDILRLPGTTTSLEGQRALGAEVRVVYSAWDSLEIARRHPKKKVIFLAVGFETTAPTVALTVLAARRRRLNNLLFYSSLKLIPPAMEALVSDRRIKIDGFLCPGHVSTVIGAGAYEFIARRYKIPCCVAGFEPLDIIEGIYLLLSQIVQNKSSVQNQYSRVVKKNGNPKAKAIIKEVFKVSDAVWRGIGEIPKSGLKLREKFSNFDVEKMIPLNITHKTLNIKQKKCRCGQILKGMIEPAQCPLFGKACRPENPIGPCMVSSEGTCNAYYRYK